MRFVYPYTVHQSDDGAWQVRFPDVPEALTEGETEDEAHALATDVLLAALSGLTKLRRDLPAGGLSLSCRHCNQPSWRSIRAMRERGLNKVTLAHKLGKKEGEVRRMLDLDHQTKIGSLENALWQLGKQIACEVREAA